MIQESFYSVVLGEPPTYENVGIAGSVQKEAQWFLKSLNSKFSQTWFEGQGFIKMQVCPNSIKSTFSEGRTGVWGGGGGQKIMNFLGNC